MITMAYNEGDDYVECDACGHPIERHGLKGCEAIGGECGCDEMWTVKEIQQLRREHGLSGSFNSWNY